MTRSLLILIILPLYLTSTAQVTCEVSNLSKADKELIQHFWTKFKIAVNKSDKNALLNLCSLPFECSYCGEGGSNEDDVQVTEKSFLDQHYKIFFEPEFKKLLTRDSLPVSTNYGDKQDKCSYRFGYTLIKETKQTPGQQRFFVIEKINGQFRITETWTVP